MKKAKANPITCVYSVACPITKLVMYVGITSDFEKRKSQHERGHKQSELGFWAKELRKHGYKAIVEILDDIDFDEYYWIEQMLAWGMPLFNSTKAYPLRHRCKFSIHKEHCQISAPTKGYFVTHLSIEEKKSIAEKIVSESILLKHKVDSEVKKSKK